MLSDDIECDPCLVVMVTGLDGDSISGVLDVTDSPRLGPVVLRQPGPIRGEYCDVSTNHSSPVPRHHLLQSAGPVIPDNMNSVTMSDCQIESFYTFNISNRVTTDRRINLCRERKVVK